MGHNEENMITAYVKTPLNFLPLTAANIRWRRLTISATSKTLSASRDRCFYLRSPVVFNQIDIISHLPIDIEWECWVGTATSTVQCLTAIFALFVFRSGNETLFPDPRAVPYMPYDRAIIHNKTIPLHRALQIIFLLRIS